MLTKQCNGWGSWQWLWGSWPQLQGTATLSLLHHWGTVFAVPLTRICHHQGERHQVPALPGTRGPILILLPGHLASTSARPHAVCLEVSSPQAKGRGQRNPEVTSCRERLLISSCLSDILSRWQSVQLDPLHPTTGCCESSTLVPILCYVQIRAQPASCNAQCHCHSPWSFLAVLWQVSLLSFPLLGLSLGFSSLPCPPPCPCFFFLWSFSL